jgi:hypothetical protein
VTDRVRDRLVGRSGRTEFPSATIVTRGKLTGMPSTTRRRGRAAAAPQSTPDAPGARRWLLLVHQLPATPSNVRVRVWRRLQQIGALTLKQAVHVLPDSPSAREDFEWLRAEIEAGGGEALVLEAATLDEASDTGIVESFRAARAQAYDALERTLGSARARGRARRRPPTRPWLHAMRARLAAIERIDFFASPGRDRVAARLDALAAAIDKTPAAERGPRTAPTAPSLHGRLWITRPRPGVDRMSSAWLIRRFIDPAARFGFVTSATDAAADAIPFDMFGVEFSHHGGACTFETLCARFGLDDPGLRRLAAIVHDLDLKDDRFGVPEAATVGLAIEGLQLAHADDGTLLDHGMTLFDALYRSLARSGGPGRTPGRRRPRARAGR